MDVCIQFQGRGIELVDQFHQFLVGLVDRDLSGNIAIVIHVFFTLSYTLIYLEISRVRFIGSSCRSVMSRNPSL